MIRNDDVLADTDAIILPRLRPERQPCPRMRRMGRIGARNDTTRATSPGRGRRWVGSVVKNRLNPPTGGYSSSIAQDFGNIGRDGADVVRGQLALVGAIDLDCASAPHQDREVRILG